MVCSGGYSLGSAKGGRSWPTTLFPSDGAYTKAALVGVGAVAIRTLATHSPMPTARPRPTDRGAGWRHASYRYAVIGRQPRALATDTGAVGAEDACVPSAPAIA